jgi:UDP-4-amino-4,6-dideoxy-N-acetyl-beta-L-altrosamine N-acetyltransferase
MLKKVETFSIPPLRLENFTILLKDQLLEILNWRNSKEISLWMYNTDKISEDNHLSFCESLKYSLTSAYYLVYKNETPIGVVTLTNYNSIEETGEFGFYLNPKFFKTGMGLDVFFAGLELLFKKFNLEKIIGFVKIENSNAMQMNDFFGMKEIELVKLSDTMYSKRLIYKLDWLKFGFKPDTLLSSFSQHVKKLRSSNNILKSSR